VEEKRETSNLTDLAYEQLRRAILVGDLKPGQLYTAGELAERVGVSRTPIREALLELERKGMVEIVKNRGMRVRQTSLEDLLEGFEVRLMLEVPLTRRATELQDGQARALVESVFLEFEHAARCSDIPATLRADRDFHRSLLAGSGNVKAVQMLFEQRNLVLSGGVETVPRSRSARECFEDHRDIFEAFMNRDGFAAATAMGRHISNTARMLINQEIQRRPDFGDKFSVERLSWILH
jgi:DNA-binding GntR family transcriptional regulator